MNFEGKTLEQYKTYAMERRNKSKIANIIDKWFHVYRELYNDVPLLNGGISSDSSGNPIYYFCIVGDGVKNTETDRFEFYTNYYTIYFWSGLRGVTIYKATNGSIHHKCYNINSPDLFGYKFFSSGCRVYEELSVEEILNKLVNKNWITFNNVQKSKANVEFLKAMKQRLIKVLVYNKIIYKRQNGKYEDIKYFGKLK